MNRLQVINQNDQLVLDSREVAGMVDKRHDNLMADIKNYINYLEQSTDLKSQVSEFFIESTYQDSTGRTLPNYQITKKGCEFIAHKLTGQKGTLFTATYINKFHEMEAALAQLNKPKQKTLPTWDRATLAHIRVAKEIAKATGIRMERAITVALAKAQAETGQDLNEYRKLLPPVSEEDAETLNASQLGEPLNLKASQVNLLLEKMGLQYGVREPGKRPGTMRLVDRNPWHLTDEGRKYGIEQDATQEGVTKKGNRHHWEGFQIFWKPIVRELLEKFIAESEGLAK